MRFPRTIIIALAALAIAAGCGGGGGSDSSDAASATTAGAAAAGDTAPDATPCTDMFAPGRPTDQVIADYNKNPCTDDQGNTYVTPVVSRECPDGTTRYYVEGYGTGVSGQPWQPATDAGAVDATAC